MGKIIDDTLRRQLQNERNAQCHPSAEELLADLRNVGPNKPMGYLPLDAIKRNCNTTPEALQSELCAKGLKAEELYHNPHALVVWDEDALQSLLDKNQETLMASKWPTDANEFAEYIMQHSAPAYTVLFDVVADAFADYRSPGRYQLGDPPAPPPSSLADKHQKRDVLGLDGSANGKG